MKMTYYISGPMRGVPRYNFPAFNRAAERLRSEGHEAINPAEEDVAIGLDPAKMPDDWDWSRLPPGFDLADFAARDIESIKRADGIFMLPGWKQSEGATAEYHIAKWLGLVIVDSCTSAPAERKKFPIATGLLDYFPDAVWAVARCSWAGGQQHNPGEPLHWSRDKSNDHADCMMRHFMERGTVDEDGVRHMTKTVWRAMALLQLEIEEARDG